MEPDLHGMRAFVAAAEELHFGRAAERLFLTQQALSKRVRRLEEALGASLFARTTRRVELTAAGRRFLPLARDVVDAYDRAVSAFSVEPLRVDVHAERFTPMKLLRAAVERAGVRVESSMRQGLGIALPAVLNGELDAAFGRAADMGPWPAELLRRPVQVVSVDAFVVKGHPLAGRSSVGVEELRDFGVVMPDPGGSTEWRGWLERFRDELGVPVRFAAPALGVRDYSRLMREEKRAVVLGESGTDLPHDPDMRQIRIVDPTPLHVWSIVWRRDDRDPRLARLLEALPEARTPGRGWLPEIDRALLRG
ncbi:LysR family transcriptional regulator [Spirillospora sp. NPDC029432]|uniref:LysR family transcriptional regulator n=1 Tax=Spirillospora sp. NPDC029432 TaxID=3154599 RepID=UPI0034526E3E